MKEAQKQKRMETARGLAICRLELDPSFCYGKRNLRIIACYRCQITFVEHSVLAVPFLHVAQTYIMLTDDKDNETKNQNLQHTMQCLAISQTRTRLLPQDLSGEDVCHCTNIAAEHWGYIISCLYDNFGGAVYNPYKCKSQVTNGKNEHDKEISWCIAIPQPRTGTIPPSMLEEGVHCCTLSPP